MPKRKAGNTLNQGNFDNKDDSGKGVKDHITPKRTGKKKLKQGLLGQENPSVTDPSFSSTCAKSLFQVILGTSRSNYYISPISRRCPCFSKSSRKNRSPFVSESWPDSVTQCFAFFLWSSPLHFSRDRPIIQKIRPNTFEVKIRGRHFRVTFGLLVYPAFMTCSPLPLSQLFAWCKLLRACDVKNKIMVGWTWGNKSCVSVGSVIRWSLFYA